MLKKYQTLRIWSSFKALDDFIKFFCDIHKCCQNMTNHYFREIFKVSIFSQNLNILQSKLFLRNL